jgi:hypothetical protein
MADEDDQDDGGAAQAFAELRADIALMRKAVEALPAAIEEVAAPDYAPSFGALTKGLTGVEARLAGIEDHPALKLTPEQHGRAIQRAGAEVLSAAAKALREAADAVARERQALGGIVGATRDRQGQKRALLWALGIGAAAGFLLFPLLGAFAPGGSYLATWATGNVDRWQAGAGLMQAANPAGAQALANASRLVNANAEALQVCAEAARKAGKEQKCAVTVASPGQ